MKLLRVIPSLDPKWGGPIEAARTLDREILRFGHSVEVLCLDSPDAGPFHNTYPAKVHALGPSWLKYHFNPRLIPWLKDNHRRFDAVIVDGLWQHHGFGVRQALIDTATPYFVFTHGMLSPWFKRMYPLKHLKKWMYWPWGDYRVLRDARAVLFTCEEERRLARKSFWLYRCNEALISLGTPGPPKSNVEHISTFFDAYPDLQHKRILLFLGRIHRVKGCDLLIEAFAKVANIDPRLQLVMAGPDQTGWMTELKQLAQILGLADRVTWLGMLQSDDRWDALHSAEALCLPSHQENFGVVVAEAMACGKPVLISNKVNIWREIDIDGAGIVQDDNLEGTVRGLAQWLALTPEAKQKMRYSARQCFDARYRSDRTAESLINFLKERVAAESDRCLAEFRQTN